MSWKALTLVQPMATAIARGPKRIENRTTPIARKLAPVWLGLHAGKKWDYDYEAFVDNIWKARPVANPIGCMLGAMLIDWVERYYPNEPKDARGVMLDHDPWATGPWCLHVAEVRLLPEPVPCRGMQGLWPVRDPALSIALDCLVSEADLAREKWVTFARAHENEPDRRVGGRLAEDGTWDYAACAGCGWEGPWNDPACPDCKVDRLVGYDPQAEP